MRRTDDFVRDELLRLLELLALEAPPHQFTPPTGTGTDDWMSAESQALLDRARTLALDIHGLFARRQQREAALAALVDTARELTLPYDVDALLQVIARRARLLLNFDMAWITLRDPTDGCTRVRVSDGHTSTLTPGFVVPAHGGVGNAAADRSAPFWTPDYLTDERFPHSPPTDEVAVAECLHGLMAVPLKEGTDTFGALYGADRSVRHFTPDEITLMSSLGDLASLAIKKARLLAQTRSELSELELDVSRALDSSSAALRLGGIHTQLIDMVLSGQGLSKVAAHAAAELGGALMVRDATGRTLVVTGDFPGLDETALFQRTLDAHAELAAVRSAEGMWLCPATAGREVLGTLILAPDGPVTDHQLQLLRATAQSIAVLLQMEAGAEASPDGGRGRLLQDLITDSPRSPEQLAVHARRLGVALDDPHVVLIARPDGGASGRSLVWASSYAHRMAGLQTIVDDCLVLLVPGTDSGAAGRAVTAELSAVTGRRVTVGSAGPVAHPGPVHATYQEARRCLEALTALGTDGGSASAQELGFLGLLLADSPDIPAFVQTTIGPVIAYDLRHCTDLVHTLEAHFASGGSPRRAAEALHVHPNTVSRRLERITDLLGPTWQQPMRALEVQLALRLQRTRHAVRSPLSAC
ncbi:helix-turn-helix domain-containing protein [Streptomyces sp. Ag109_G2-15]|uniref:helix-turn-helix domain-containing protein n=1 Tax=Streptomyces sp. Ag109_G2-15 TaxID=1938850 RepID=UPI000BCBF3AB|nr:helix-turn-helix domain-containing protein [Streptomyces sp. Ag109_G2-15]SOD85423.1 GAF domain-containing protein [Streptomyces sp. Ag109_G2-15]